MKPKHVVTIATVKPVTIATVKQ